MKIYSGSVIRLRRSSIVRRTQQKVRLLRLFMVMELNRATWCRAGGWGDIVW